MTAATVALALATLVGAARLSTVAQSGLVRMLSVAVLAHLVAWACRRLRVPGGGALTALGVALAVTWLVLPQTTFHGLPTATTWRVAGSHMARAVTVLNQGGSVEAAGPGLLLLLLAVTGASAALADHAAFRMGRPLMAVMPSSTLLLAGSRGSSPRAAATALAAYAVATLAFLFVHEVGRRRVAAPGFATAGEVGAVALLPTASVLTAAVVAAGLTLGPHVPGAGRASMVGPASSAGRLPGGGVAPPGAGVRVEPLVDIRGSLRDRPDTEVFSVETDRPNYWRLVSLDRFDGTLWSSTLQRGPAGAVAPSTGPADFVGQRFRISSLVSDWLPAAYRPGGVFLVNAGWNVTIDPDTSALAVDAITSGGVIYDVTSRVPRWTAAELSGLGGTVPTDIAGRYLDLPLGLSPRVRQEARRVVGAASGPYAKAMALQRYFRDNFTYDLSAPPGHGTKALDRFLFQTRRGYCEQFAGAYAVMARALGLPSRVAVGFTPGELDADGRYRVRALNAHAWPEVYIDGAGWVAFEPTPGRGAPAAQSYTGVAPAQAAPPLPRGGQAPTASTVPTSPPTPPTIESAPGSPATSVVSPPSPATTAVAGQGSPVGPAQARDRRRPVPVAPLVGMVGGLLAMLALLGTPLAKRRRRRTRRAAAATADDLVLVAWAEAAEALALSGLRRLGSETLIEHAGRASSANLLGPDLARSLADLASRASRVTYAGSETALPQAELATPGTAHQARGCHQFHGGDGESLATADAVQDRVWRSLPLVRKAVCGLDPRPLWTRGRA
ncbi:MAG: transglutaminaseTgpA domain-containing protein [Acidimicrobiales bacterium]